MFKIYFFHEEVLMKIQRNIKYQIIFYLILKNIMPNSLCVLLLINEKAIILMNNSHNAKSKEFYTEQYLLFKILNSVNFF